MEKEEFVQFLKSTLIKIENAINLLEQDMPKHIPAYNKILGVQQKLACLGDDKKAQLFSQLITTRSIISYFMNGRYIDGHKQILKLKRELVNIYLSVEKNERDKNG
jgi:hypothetical protein